MHKQSCPEVAQKEALAVVHKVLAATAWHLCLSETTDEEKKLYGQLRGALSVLEHALHGKPPLDCMSSLCDVCFLRYAFLDHPFVTLKGGKRIDHLCTPCLEHLKAIGTIEMLEDWRTGEVTIWQP